MLFEKKVERGLSLKENLQILKKKYPDVSFISIDFQGSGDSFEEFYNDEVSFLKNSLLTNEQKSEIESAILDEIYDNDICFDIIELTDADFNNDGCRGIIEIDFKYSEYHCSVYHFVREEVDGVGATDTFEEESVLPTVNL